MTDEEIIQRLKKVDDGERDVTSWESKFIENVAFGGWKKLSLKQRECAANIIEKYLGKEKP